MPLFPQAEKLQHKVFWQRLKEVAPLAEFTKAQAARLRALPSLKNAALLQKLQRCSHTDPAPAAWKAALRRMVGCGKRFQAERFGSWGIIKKVCTKSSLFCRL